jgi:hypothetical protein
MGELWDPRQLPAALGLIDASKEGQHTPVVATYVHGWKSNADNRSDRLNGQNDNIVGFEGVLEYLKAKYPERPVVGVFVSWRGDLISKYWPLRRQLSYFNRERTAIRIPGVSMTDALTKIMVHARANTPNALVLMIGHSFGALVLERALSQVMTDFVERHKALASRSDGDGAWADLTVFVNSAAAATEGKQMLNLLKGFSNLSPAGAAGSATEWPLFLSISSLGDAATRFALPIGHGVPFLGYQFNGSWRKSTRSTRTT